MNEHIEFYKSLNVTQKKYYKDYKLNNTLEGLPLAYELNRKLRNNEIISGKWYEALINLDNITSKYKHNKELVLYRATHTLDIYQFKKGETFVFPNFSSTSIKLIAMQQFFKEDYSSTTPVLLKIKCEINCALALFEGTPGSTVEEAEVLLPRNIKLDIENYLEIKDTTCIENIMGVLYANGTSSLQVYKLIYRAQ